VIGVLIMPHLKGLDIGGYINIPRKVRFTNTVLAPALNSSPWAKAWFVDGVSGSDAYEGTAPERSKVTIDAALQLMGRGDVLYIRPKTYTVGTGFARYTETGTLDLLQSDVSIIGVTNSLNPEYGVRWAKTSAGYCLDNYAPAMHVENIGFFAEGGTGAVKLWCDGASNLMRGVDGTTFYNCVIKAGRILALSGGDGLVFRECMFHAAPAGGATGGITFSCSATPGRRLRILDCIFQEGNAAAGATEYINIAGVASEVLIDRCRFGLIPTSGKFVLVTSSTGMISNCYFQSADVDLTDSLTLGGLIGVGLYDATMVVPS
jgi:hypothetical protein